MCFSCGILLRLCIREGALWGTLTLPRSRFLRMQSGLRTVFEFYSYRKDKEGLKEYLKTHREEVKALDEESRFLLGTITKEKRLLEHLKKAKKDENESEKKEETDMCQAIQEMIDEGKAEGKATSIIYLLTRKGELSKET